MARLESTALHLESTGDLRTLVCLVEQWREVGEPTAPARLAQARALVRLGLMDRAWSRLQELLAGEAVSADALVLTASTFLDRGWTRQARHTLARALADHPEHPELQRLWDRAAEPPTQPDLDAADAAHADPETMLAAAEHHMALGSFVRARSLLERALRAAPATARARDLLWALGGDFRLDLSLAEIAARYGPDLGTLADLADEAEHTAELDGPARGLEPADGASSFPNLFRDLEPHTEHALRPGAAPGRAAEAEVTQLSSLARLDELRRGEAEAAGEDTRILRVVHRRAPPPPAREEPDATFDLATARREAGTPYPPSAPRVSGGCASEEEDDDLIVITRRDGVQDVTETTAAVGGLDLKPEEAHLPPGGRALVDEDAAWVHAAARASALAPASEAAADLPDDLAPTRSWPWFAAAAGVVLTLGGALLLALLAQLVSFAA